MCQLEEGVRDDSVQVSFSAHGWLRVGSARPADRRASEEELEDRIARRGPDRSHSRTHLHRRSRTRRTTRRKACGVDGKLPEEDGAVDSATLDEEGFAR